MVVKNIDQLQSQFGVIRVALSGGTTPVPIYRELTKIDLSSIDWNKLNLKIQVSEFYIFQFSQVAQHIHHNLDLL